jgi:hypothetical protein
MKAALRLMTVVLLFLAAAGAAAVDDFGFTIDNATGYTYEGNAGITQRNKFSHWLDGRIGENLTFAYQLSYTFSLDRYVLLDLDLLRFGGTFALGGAKPFIFAFNSGRFFVSEFSGNVLSHLWDGFKLEFSLPSAVFSAAAGYTGLLQTPSSSVIVTASDEVDQNADPPPVFGPLAAPRLAGMVAAEFPELFLRQTLNAAFIFQFDLRGDARIAPGRGRIHTQYIGAGLSGPIISSLYYDTFFYLNTGQSDGGLILGVLSGGGLTLYLPKAAASKVSASFVYAGGDADHVSLYEGNTAGNSTAFIPLSASSSGLVVSPRLTNVFFPSAGYSLKPFSFIESSAARNFSIEMKMFPFFRSTPAPVSVGGVDDASASLYLGTELDFIIKARPLSDLGLGWSMGFFFPGTAMEEKTVRSLGRFDLSLSF